jgi:hypothetical protein
MPDASSGKKRGGARLEPRAHPEMTIAKTTNTTARIGNIVRLPSAHYCAIAAG